LEASGGCPNSETADADLNQIVGSFGVRLSLVSMKLLFPNLVFCRLIRVGACSGERSIAMSYRYANLPIEQVRPNAKNTRTHSKKQIRQIATSIRELGFAAPVVCTEKLSSGVVVVKSAKDGV